MVRNIKYDHNVVVTGTNDGSKQVSKDAWNDGHDELGMFGHGTPTTLTIATGAIIPISSMHLIDGQGAADDNLDNITNTETADRDELWLIKGVENITLRDNSVSGGNIFLLSGNTRLLDANKPVRLIRSGTNWHEFNAGGNGVFTNITGFGAQTQTLDLNTQILQFVDSDTTITAITNDLEYDVDTANEHRWRVANTTELTLDATALILAAGNNLVLQASGATGYLEVGALTTPTTPTNGLGKYYTKELAAITTPFFIGDDGTEINLAIGAEITTWTANHDAAGFDLINVGGIQINNPTDTFQYIITPAAIAADRILNLPLMTGTDTLVLEAFDATLTNKTIDLDSNTITGTTTEFNTALQADTFAFISDNLSVFAATTSLQFIGVISDETGTGLVVFNDTPTIITPTIASFTNATHNHSNAAGGGTFASTNLSDTGDIAYLNTVNTYNDGLKQTFNPDATNAGINVGAHTADPSSLTDADLWYNSTSNVLTARINGASVNLGSGSQTPWTSDIDGDGFDLIDLSNILFRNSTGVPTSTDRSIHYNDTEGMIFNALLGDFFQLEINGVAELQLTNTRLNIFNNDFSVGTGSIEFVDTDTTITSVTNDLEYDVTTGNSHRFRVNNITEMELDDTNGLVMSSRDEWKKGSDISSADAITLGNDGNFFDVTGATTINHILNTNWQDGSVIVLKFTGSLTLTHDSGLEIGDEESLFLQGDVNFITSTNDILTFILTPSGWEEISRATFINGAQTPWIADVDADGSDLIDLSNIVFRSTDGAPTSTDRSIHYEDTEGMVFNTLTGDFYQWEINAVAEMQLTNTQLDLFSNNIVNLGTLNTHTVPSGTSTFALFSDNLSVFASTTSLQFIGVISDETGTGLLVFNNTPTLLTPTIADFTNSTHDHSNAAGGGQLTNSALTSGVFAAITGLGTQSQVLNMGGFGITDGGIIQGDTVEVINAGAGTNPTLTSNSATNNLLLVNDQLEINNVGAGANPIFLSNDAGQILDLTGSLDISGTLTAGTYTGQSSVVTLGTITSGVWEGTPVASAFLDADTAHLTTTQTFTGAKTFGAPADVGKLIIAGTTSGTTVLDATAIASGILTLPAVTDTLVGKNTTDVFTNKSYDADGTGNVLTNIGSSEIKSELITGFSTVTAASGDFVLISDTTDSGNLKKVDANDFLGGASLPVVDTTSIAEGSGDSSKEVRFEVDGNTGGVVGVLATIFTTAKTVTFPDATDTLMGKATTDVFTNKSYDLGGTGNVLTGSVAEFNTALQSETFSYIGVANAWGTVNQNIAATGKWQESGANISPIGTHEMSVPASGMWASTTNGALGLNKIELGTNDIDIQTFDFTSTAADEHVQFIWSPPEEWDAGTIRVKFKWSHAAGTGNVRWGMQATSRANSEALDTAWGTIQEVTDANEQDDDIIISDFTPAITVLGAGKGEYVQFRVLRSGSDGADTFTSTARLHEIIIEYSVDAATST